PRHVHLTNDETFLSTHRSSIHKFIRIHRGPEKICSPQVHLRVPWEPPCLLQLHRPSHGRRCGAALRLAGRFVSRIAEDLIGTEVGCTVWRSAGRVGCSDGGHDPGQGAEEGCAVIAGGRSFGPPEEPLQMEYALEVRRIHGPDHQLDMIAEHLREPWGRIGLCCDPGWTVPLVVISQSRFHRVGTSHKGDLPDQRLEIETCKREPLVPPDPGEDGTL